MAFWRTAYPDRPELAQARELFRGVARYEYHFRDVFQFRESYLRGRDQRIPHIAMRELIEFLIQNGYWVLFVWVLGEQLGLPLPSIPLLLAAGALAGMNRLALGWVIVLALMACVLADVAWYEVGRRRGGKVLKWLCRISLEPDSCVRRTEEAFSRNGSRSLAAAKFVPGLNTMAPPMAGITGMSVWRFLLFDGAGALLYVAGTVLVGYLFRDQIERAAVYALRLGGMLFWLAVAGLAAYIFKKYRQRQRFLKEITVARITPEDLRRKLDGGEDMTIVDLRHPLDFLPYPQIIGNAIRMSPDEVEARNAEIPRDRDVILYCT